MNEIEGHSKQSGKASEAAGLCRSLEGILRDSMLCSTARPEGLGGAGSAGREDRHRQGLQSPGLPRYGLCAREGAE